MNNAVHNALLIVFFLFSLFAYSLVHWIIVRQQNIREFQILTNTNSEGILLEESELIGLASVINTLNNVQLLAISENNINSNYNPFFEKKFAFRSQNGEIIALVNIISNEDFISILFGLLYLTIGYAVLSALFLCINAIATEHNRILKKKTADWERPKGFMLYSKEPHKELLKYMEEGIKESLGLNLDYSFLVYSIGNRATNLKAMPNREQLSSADSKRTPDSKQIEKIVKEKDQPQNGSVKEASHINVELFEQELLQLYPYTDRVFQLDECMYAVLCPLKNRESVLQEIRSFIQESNKFNNLELSIGYSSLNGNQKTAREIFNEGVRASKIARPNTVVYFRSYLRSTET